MMKKWSYSGRGKRNFKLPAGFINEEFSQQCTLWLDILARTGGEMFRGYGFAESK